MIIRDFEPSKGQAFQGDIWFMPVPADIAVNTADEVTPIDGRLIIQEGEATGHHHAIALTKSVAPRSDHLAHRKTSITAERLMTDALAGTIAVPTARLYRDQTAVEAMRAKGLLLRADLAIGVLIVEHGPMVVSHEEHDGIRMPPGRYLTGRQVESAGAEERVVVD